MSTSNIQAMRLAIKNAQEVTATVITDRFINLHTEALQILHARRQLLRGPNFLGRSEQLENLTDLYNNKMQELFNSVINS